MGAAWGWVAVGAGSLGGLLHAANAAADRAHTSSFWVMGLATALAYGAATVLLRHSEAAWIRRVTAGIGACSGIALLAIEWSALGDVPLGSVALWVGSWLWAASYVGILAILPHVLPGGEVASQRVRASLCLSFATMLVVLVLWAVTPYPQQDFPLHLRDEVNPVGLQIATHPATVLAVGLLLLVSTGLAVTTLVIRWGRSTGQARQQLKWLLLGVAATLVLAVLARMVPPDVAEITASLAILPVPIVVAIAVLRFGLWEIDVVISRSITYLVLSASVIAVYLAAVWLLGTAVGDWIGAPVIATGLAALVALPLHAKLQRWVNLRVHGDVAEPHVALARLGDRLAAASDPEELSAHVLPAVAEQVTRSLRASGAQLRLIDGTSASHGRSIAEDATAGVARVELAYGGASVGELAVQRSGGLDAADRRVLDQLAGQAAVAAHTVLLARAVQRARAAVVVAREEERRQLRRDLHDDIGPALAALALQAEAALSLTPDEPEAAARTLARLAPRLNAAVAEVRALVHELRPPTLDDLGLGASVQALAERLSTDDTAVRVEVASLPALSAAADVVAYRIVAEALANAVRHARASQVVVHLRAAGSSLEITVADDGRGMPADAAAGLGLASMRLRAEELGGELRVSTGQAGTSVLASIPIGAETPRIAVERDVEGVS